MEEGFLRIPFPSNRIFRGADIFKLTPRGEYLMKRHHERVALNPQFGPRMREMSKVLACGELGRIDSFRFIVSENI